MTERLHTSIEHVPGPGKEPDKEWLNSLDVADQYVRHFAAEVLRRWPDGGDPFTSWVANEAQVANGLFFGIVPSDTYATGPWNSPDHLGHYLHIALPITGEDRFAVRDAFMWLALEVVKVAKEYIEHPPQQWIWRVDGLIEQVSYALVGAPLDTGDIEPADDTPTPDTAGE